MDYIRNASERSLVKRAAAGRRTGNTDTKTKGPDGAPRWLGRARQRRTQAAIHGAGAWAVTVPHSGWADRLLRV